MQLVLLNVDQDINSVKTFLKAVNFNGAMTIDGAIAVNGELSAALSLVNAENVGAKADVAPVTVKEYGDGKHHVTELTLVDYIVGAIPAAAAALTLEPLEALYTLPAGVQVLSVSYAEIALTAPGTAVTPEIGLGSVIGDGSANATLGAAGATMEDIMEGFAVADTDTHAVVVNGPVGATAGILTGIALNKAADAKTIYLNCAGTWNVDNEGNLTASGKVTIVWDTVD